MLKPTKIFFVEHEPEALCCMPWDLARRVRRVQSFLEMCCRISGSQPAFSLGNAVIWNPSLEWATFRLYLERARWCHPAGELKNKLILRSERHGSSTTVPLSLLLFCGTKTFWSHLKKELHHSHPWQSVKWTATVALRGHSCTEKRCKGNPPSPPSLEKSKHNTYMLFISQLHFTRAWMQLRYRPCITRTIS